MLNDSGRSQHTSLRLFFRAATVSNFSFFAWTLLAPDQFFRLAGLKEAEPYGFLWQCVGMLVGLYGIAYWYVSKHLEKGRILVAIGLCGKVLGPAGWIVHFALGNLPAPTFVVILLNDLIWWPGFLYYLWRFDPPGFSWLRCMILAMAATHALGSAFLLRPLLNEAHIISSAWQQARNFEAFGLFWALGWLCWCLGDIFTPWFIWEITRAYASVFRREVLLRLARTFVCLAAGLDLSLNAFYVCYAEKMFFLPFFSLTLANGLFLLGYVIFVCVLAASRAVPDWITVLGFLALSGALGLCVGGLGLPSTVPVFAGVFTTFFLFWLAALYVKDGK